jgi:hypothetical protein
MVNKSPELSETLFVTHGTLYTYHSNMGAPHYVCTDVTSDRFRCWLYRKELLQITRITWAHKSTDARLYACAGDFSDGAVDEMTVTRVTEIWPFTNMNTLMSLDDWTD